jgi:hypothetical protein
MDVLILVSAIIITILVMIVLFKLYIYWYKQNLLNTFNREVAEYCANLKEITYRKAVYVPKKNGVYEKKLATALFDISINVSNANCQNILPLPNPPKFTQQLRIVVPDPINGKPTMFAYIFWNPETNMAAVAFTGTVVGYVWYDDFQYQLVEANQLNGYRDGVKCHQGFYNIYVALRKIILHKLDQLIKENNLKYIFVTGHSLGGSLSQICAFDLANTIILKNLEIIHYSFAAARSGNVLFAKIFNSSLASSIRVNNTEDIVPALPPATFDGFTYSHTTGNLPFTRSLGSLRADHIDAYKDLPTGPEVAQI